MQNYAEFLRLHIDGEWIDQKSAHHIRVLNPANGETTGELPVATTAQLDRALEAAKRGFETWRRVSPLERGAVIRRAAALLRERADEVASLITLEQGKPLAEAKGEVVRAAEILEWDAGEAQRSYGQVIPSAAGLEQMTVMQPIGPVAAFPTWNVPCISPARKIGGAIAAGCSVVVKPSSETPAAACALVKCFVDAGLPAGVLNLVFGNAAEVSSHLIASPVIQLVSFTGPIDVGKHLAGLCARRMIPSVMELGGHAPFIVCEDADLDAAVTHGVAGRYRNAGQPPPAPTRFIIHERQYDEFVSRFAGEAAALKVGNGAAEGTRVGPMANHRRIEAMERMVADAVDRGAKLVTGGRRIGNEGYFFEPTVLAEVPLEAEAMTSEPFGPLALMGRFSDLGDAVELANSLPYGLSAFAFTRSAATSALLCGALEAGTVSINHIGGALPETPFGGLKESGYGREGGYESLRGYMVSKLYTRSFV